MKIAGVRRCLAMVPWTAAVVSLISFSGTAQAGFFDFLFGPPPQAAPPYMAYPPQSRRREARPFHKHSHKIAVHTAAKHQRLAAAEIEGPKVGPQKPVDLMDDKSLQRGDAVVTQAGIRIFDGSYGDHHRPEDFRKISEIKKLSKRERSALAALDGPVVTTPSGKSVPGGGLVTGRSASAHNITAGEIMIDPNGRTVRFVGP